MGGGVNGHFRGPDGRYRATAVKALRGVYSAGAARAARAGATRRAGGAAPAAGRPGARRAVNLHGALPQYWSY